jgi:hypothetical protein
LGEKPTKRNPLTSKEGGGFKLQAGKETAEQVVVPTVT